MKKQDGNLNPTRSNSSLWMGLIWLGLLGLPVCDMLGWTTAIAQAQTVPSPVRQAYTLLSQGRVDEAIAAFERIIQDNPRLVEARLGLGIAYRRRGRDADALRAYEQVLEIDPNNRLALSTIGLFGEYRQEWQIKGINALTTLLNLEPGNLEGRAQRAKLLFYQGRFSESLADYNVLLQNNPTPAVLIGAAEVYTYSGDYQRGLELFNRYQSTGQSVRGDAAIAYGVALRETGNAAQAVQVLEAQLRQATQLNTQVIRLRGALATAYAANQQLPQAVEVLAPLRGRQDSRLTLARALSTLNRYDPRAGYSEEAANLYLQVLSTVPNPSESWIREAADVLSDVPSQQSYALQLYQQLAQRNPSDRSAVVQQLVLANRIGAISKTQLNQQLLTTLAALPSDSAQLQRIAQTLIRIDPPDPVLLPLFQNLLSTGVNQPFLYFRIAQMYSQAGDLASAKTALGAYAATPEGTRDQGTTQLLLADIERREGNIGLAVQRYQAIVNSNDPTPGVIEGALQGLAGLLASQGQLAEAIAIYDQLIVRDPQDLRKQLARTSLALQANQISQAEAEGILYRWFQTRPLTDTPPELFSLVGALPASPQLESVYNALLQANPNDTTVLRRSLQLLASRSPAQAQARVNQLVMSDPYNPGVYFLQGQIAQDLGDTALAAQAYETILAIQPTNVDAISALAGIRFQQRRFDEANQLYNLVLSIKPEDRVAQTSLVGLIAIDGRRIEAIQQLEQIRFQESLQGASSNTVSQEIQRLEEGFLLQRGIQPAWERFGFEE